MQVGLLRASWPRRGWDPARVLDSPRCPQVALQREGYFCGEDDMAWWQFGDDTANALKTFQVGAVNARRPAPGGRDVCCQHRSTLMNDSSQACQSLPETGVCDANTWRSLLGEDTLASLNTMASQDNGDEYDDDMSASNDRVWLIGEQRWEKR